MRYLTTFVGRPKAETFVAFLLTQNISTHVETSDAEKDEWEVWVRNEDALPQANEELTRFLASPEDPRYVRAIESARTILKEQRQKQVARVRNIQTPKTMVTSSMFSGSLPPLTLTLVIICVVMQVLAVFNTGTNSSLMKIINTQLSFVEPSLWAQTEDPAASLKRFELWRIVTPGFLHKDILHLLLNMLSLVSLGRLVERLEGTARYAWIVLFVAIVAHLLQGLLPARLYGSPNFVGISGVVLGLFGYVAVKTQNRPDLGFYLPTQSYVMTGLLILFGFSESKYFPLAAIAHLAGLVAGGALGYLFSDPRFDTKST